MKIILSAYACEPGKGSEPGVGWNTAREIAKYHEAWILTSNTHRAGIEAELAQRPVTNLHFVYLDPLGWVYDWSNEEKRTHWSIHLHYYFWQIQAYAVARHLHQDISADLAHHVTYVKYSSPSFLSLLPIPFVWGPVAGGETTPLSFLQDFSFRGKAYELLRSFASRIGELDPCVRLTAQRSAIARATTEDTAQRLRKLGAKNVQVLTQIGLSKDEIGQLERQAEAVNHQVRFVSIGRLLHWKGFHLGLRAFAQADLPDAEYWILGDGAERSRLEALARKLKIDHQVKFLGKLSRIDTLTKLSQCSVLVHPSLHESGGFVCIEAMAACRPVICLDLGGPAQHVTENTGIKVLAHTPSQAVQDLAAAMTQLAKNPELRSQMGRAAQKRVRDHYRWESRGKLLAQLYEDICTQHKFSNLLGVDNGK
jgi:glycosyltransferase involved in cell wall biosynthesis